jgi:hypothetical protein
LDPRVKNSIGLRAITIAEARPHGSHRQAAGGWVERDAELRKAETGAQLVSSKRNSDKQNARIEHDKALARVIIGLMKDDTELFKQFSDNPDFKRWLSDTVFGMTYERPADQDNRA